MLRDTLRTIFTNGKDKKDGVYTIRRNTYYVIHNGSVIAYCEYDWPNWGIYQVVYWIASRIWEVENESDIREKMKEFLKLYKQ